MLYRDTWKTAERPARFFERRVALTRMASTLEAAA